MDFEESDKIIAFLWFLVSQEEKYNDYFCIDEPPSIIFDFINSNMYCFDFL